MFESPLGNFRVDGIGVLASIIYDVKASDNGPSVSSVLFEVMPPSTMCCGSGWWQSTYRLVDYPVADCGTLTR